VATLLDLYQARFVPEAETDAAWTDLREARQREDEPILGWHSRLRFLFQRAYPDLDAAAIEVHADIRKYFILGLAHDQVKMDTWKLRPATYQLAYQHASNNAASIRLFQPLQPMSAVKTEPGLYAVGDGLHANTQCYWCGKMGHRKFECRSFLGTARGGSAGSSGGSSSGSGSTASYGYAASYSSSSSSRGRGGPRGGRSGSGSRGGGNNRGRGGSNNGSFRGRNRGRGGNRGSNGRQVSCLDSGEDNAEPNDKPDVREKISQIGKERHEQGGDFEEAYGEALN
jgi:hypothetical protein